MRVWGIVAVLGIALAARAATADDLTTAAALHDQGSREMEKGAASDDDAKIHAGAVALRKARALYETALKSAGTAESDRTQIRTHLFDIDTRLDWYAEFYNSTPGSGDDPDAEEPAESHTIDPAKGALLQAWTREARKQYDATEDGYGRAQIAREIAEKAGVIGLTTLLDLFVKEDGVDARAGIREALAAVGTSRVAEAMATYASPSKWNRRDDALEVIYTCLEKSDKSEPERPFCRAIRRFHEQKNRKLTLRIIEQLDAMGTPGIAALGEIVYVEDFGYHDHVVSLLAKKRDRRAVPPLVFKMNRFKFEYAAQIPAHKALLELGWYAVPELIARLDDKAAGIWISWTLRKITSETMGTDKRKWHDWWKHESVRHPELFEDPDERPGAPRPTTPTTPR